MLAMLDLNQGATPTRRAHTVEQSWIRGGNPVRSKTWEVHMRILLQLIGAIFTTFLLGVCTVACADDLSRTVTAHGLTLHYGVVPSSKPGKSGSTEASDVPSPGHL